MKASWSDVESNVLWRTERLFPCHLPSWGLSLSSQVGWEPQLSQSRHSWQWCPTQGICRTCLQFVSIFRYNCRCTLRNTSPQKTRAIAPEFYNHCLLSAASSPPHRPADMEGPSQQPCMLAHTSNSHAGIRWSPSFLNLPKCHIFLC